MSEFFRVERDNGTVEVYKKDDVDCVRVYETGCYCIEIRQGDRVRSISINKGGEAVLRQFIGDLSIVSLEKRIEELENVLLGLVTDIAASGGITKDGGLAAQDDWTDLAETYKAACAALRLKPVYVEDQLA